VAEDQPIQITELRHPTQCVLWENPGRIGAKFFEIFDEVETYEDSSHLTRSLYKCRKCGQLYFFEWYEWVDWDEGNDKMYSTLLPVQSKEEGRALNRTTIYTLMTYFPRLQWDGGKAGWVGKR
jgi:hypothetical protein